MMQRRHLLTGRFAQQPAAAVGLLSPLLGLKHVQAELYRQGNAANLLSGAEAGLLSEIAQHKQQHVAGLAQALAAPPLSAPPAAPPAVRFDGAFATRDSYLNTAYTLENALVSFYLGMPALAVAETLGAQFQLVGLCSADCRALAVLGVLTGRPVVGGVLTDVAFQPISAEQLATAFRPFLADAGSAASSAGVTW